MRKLLDNNHKNTKLSTVDKESFHFVLPSGWDTKCNQIKHTQKGHLLYVVATEMGRAHAALVCIWLQSHVKVTSCHQVLLCVCAHERDLSSYTAVSPGISWSRNIPRHGTDGGLLSPHDIFSIGTMVIVFVHILGLRLCAGNDSDISLVEAAFDQSGCSVFCVLSHKVPPITTERSLFSRWKRSNRQESD